MKKIVIPITVLLLSAVLFSNYFFNKQLTKPTIDANEAIETIIEESKDDYSKIDFKKYHTKIDEIAEANDVYGMQAVAFKGEEIIDSYNYGYADIVKKTAVNDKTVFRIASTSKMISNMLIMKLVDEGKISLDSNLKEVTGLNYDDEVKLYQLLTHTSGIVDSGIFNDNLESVYDINYLLDISSVNKPGTEYCYTNFGAGTMAAIVECITGEYFMDYAQRELFDYLGLNAAYVCEYLDEGSEIAKMYMDGEVFDPSTWEYNYDFYRSFKLGKQYRLAYGNMYISASDLAKLGMVLAGNGMLDGKLVLSYNALNEIRTIRDEAKDYKYLMGLNTDLFMDLVPNRRIWGHTGSAYNALSTLLYDPEDNTGIVILTNHALNRKNEAGYPSIFYDIINLAYEEIFDTK